MTDHNQYKIDRLREFEKQAEHSTEKSAQRSRYIQNQIENAKTKTKVKYFRKKLKKSNQVLADDLMYLQNIRDRISQLEGQ